MSGGKGRGKQSRDTVAEDALVARPGPADALFAAREGPTDAQIDAPRQGLPHLTDPASLQDSRAGKQPAGTGTTGKQPAAQKRTRTTRHDTQTQPLLLAADAFGAAPEADPEWCKPLGANPPEHERTGHLAGRQDEHAGTRTTASACTCSHPAELRHPHSLSPRLLLKL